MKPAVRVWFVVPTLFILCGSVCVPTLRGGTAEPSDIALPEGFRMEVFAEDVKNARAMCWGAKGTLFVGSRDEGAVYALKDTNNDGKADERWTVARNLEMPAGVAFRDGDLYISAVSRIVKLEGIEDRLASPPEPVLVTDKYPDEKQHGWKFISFGPDGKLYVPVGAPCNICLSEDSIFASMTRLDLNTGEIEVIAHGIRNSVGFDWDPSTNELWFTENGRDWLGDDSPDCELDHLTSIGQHFGFPYCHAGTVPDPEFGKLRPCSEFIPPVAKLGPHVSPLGMRFYTGKMFPEEYRNAIFIAEHGSWNRSTPIGYRVVVAFPQADGTARTEVFAEGWLKGARATGRPVDVLVAPDGSLLVSDDSADRIYRIVHDPD